MKYRSSSRKLAAHVVVYGATGLVAAACSGTEGGAIPEAKGAEARTRDGEAPGPFHADAGASDAAPLSTVDAARPRDAAPPASDAAGDAAADMRIDPIEVGREWTYAVEVYGAYPLCRAGSSTGRVLSERVVASKRAFQVQSLCPGAGVSSYAVEGDKVEVYLSNTWVLALDAPVAAGHTWSNGVSTFTWEDAGTYTVPAGTFARCFRARENVAYASYTVFCRGVGPVHWHLRNAGGNGFDAKLTAKSF